MLWITRMALKKPWLTMLVAALVTGASIWALLTMKMELLPDIEFPMTTVITVYPQAQADEVAELVTIPIEDIAANLSGISHVTSTSSAGGSIVFFEFEYGTNMAGANEDLARYLAEVELPEAVRNLPAAMTGFSENPRLFEININSMPVVTLSLTGDTSAEELRQAASDIVQPALEAIDGVNSVSVEGGTADKVLVTPDVAALARQGVSLGNLEEVLRAGDFTSLDEIEKAVLRPDGLTLGEVAAVSVGQSGGASVSRTNGKPSVSISVSKEKEANTVTTGNAVIEELPVIETALPEGMSLVVVTDQTEYIENSVSDLSLNAVIGSVLAVVVVFLFLMAIRPSLVTAVSIPLSLLFAFLLMRSANITINILTLSAMIIAVGRVIDNSIVILEVIYRRLQRGEAFRTAAIDGVKEVVAPITSATVATIVIFLPLGFMGGLIGEMFLPFAWTISFALAGSLLIALTVVPALSGYLVARTGTVDSGAASPRYLGFYTRALKWCLNYRKTTLAIAISLFLGSFGLMGIIGTSFIPAMGGNMLQVKIEMPADTEFAATDEVTRRVEAVLDAHPNVINYHAVVGGGSGGNFSDMLGGSGLGNYASIRVNTSSEVETEAVVESLREELDGLAPGGEIVVAAVSSMGGGMASGLEIMVLGDTYEDVTEGANLLVEDLRAGQRGEATAVAGEGGFAARMDEMNRRALKELDEIELELEAVQPRLVILPDTDKIMDSGLPIGQLASLGSEFMLMQLGGTVGEAVIDGVPREIFVEGIAGGLTDLETAGELLVGYPTSVPLGEIATLELGEQLSRVRRYDGKLSATVTATIGQEDIGAVNRAVQSRLNSLEMPEGVETGMGGIAEDMRKGFSGMFIAIGVAMVLAFVVLVVTFRSFRNPLIIMASLPLASIGALVGQAISGRPLGMSALMGVLMLVGIVLTNAVVLIAVVNQMRQQGTSAYDALVEGGRTRLRPILMTALTTMIAMVPLAVGLGEGVLMAAELATVVIGGLFSSTLLTLLVIPTIYAMVNRVPRQSASDE